MSLSQVKSTDSVPEGEAEDEKEHEAAARAITSKAAEAPDTSTVVAPTATLRTEQDATVSVTEVHEASTPPMKIGSARPLPLIVTRDPDVADEGETLVTSPVTTRVTEFDEPEAARTETL